MSASSHLERMVSKEHGLDVDLHHNFLPEEMHRDLFEQVKV